MKHKDIEKAVFPIEDGYCPVCEEPLRERTEDGEHCEAEFAGYEQHIHCFKEVAYCSNI